MRKKTYIIRLLKRGIVGNFVNNPTVKTSFKKMVSASNRRRSETVTTYLYQF